MKPLGARPSAGLGVAGVCVPGSTGVDGGELIPLLARFQGPAYPFHLAYPLSRYMSNHLRVFIPWATELFGRLA